MMGNSDSMKIRNELFTLFLILCPLAFFLVTVAIRMTDGGVLVLIPLTVICILVAVFVIGLIVFALVMKPQDFSQYSGWIIGVMIFMLLSFYMLFRR